MVAYAPTIITSIDEYAALPTDEPWEVWEGELQRIPGAGALASGIAGEICAHLIQFVKPRKLGVVAGANGTFIFNHQPLTIVIPDVSLTRYDRLPGGVVPKGFCPVPPDLAVEVRSPTVDPRVLPAKLTHYQRAAVPLVWCVDPDPRTVRVYRNGEMAAELGEADTLDGEDILPGFRLPVAEIFA